jgi:hypothetical protein
MAVAPPPPPPKRSKTETLSLRLDPKTKFMLDFIARIQGQSITTVVEKAVREAANKTGISAPDEQYDRYWSDFWDPSEGIRTLNLIADKSYETTYDEDELHNFTVTHWPFFYTNASSDTPRRPYIDLLWPKIGHYLDIWREKRNEDYWAAGKEMAADLTAAKVAAPDWPVVSAKPTTNALSGAKTSGPRESFSADLDDEIPF